MAPATPTPDEAAKNTAAEPAGAVTQTDPKNEAQPEKTFTQADLDRIVQNRLQSGVKAGVKAELKKLLGEDGPESIEDLQRKLSETERRAQTIEARESVRDYLSDAKNKLNVKAENIAAITKLVMPDITFDDKGQPSNLKEAIETAKVLAPALFANTPGHINAGEGRTGVPVAGDMNSWLRDQHATRNGR